MYATAARIGAHADPAQFRVLIPRLGTLGAGVHPAWRCGAGFRIERCKCLAGILKGG